MNAAEHAEATVQVRNRLGLHVRPAARIVRAAVRFQSDVTLAMGDQVVDAKEVMEIMMLGAGRGAALRVRAEGPDAAEAVAALEALFATGCGEE